MEERTNASARRGLPAVAALLSALALAGPAAAQNLGAPDAPPAATPKPTPTEVAPAPAPAPTPAPTPTPTPSPAPSPTPGATAAPTAPSDAAAAQAAEAAARARAAAARERARARRAAAQRKRIRTNIAAVRTAAMDGGRALAVTREGARAGPAAAGAAAVGPVDAEGSGDGREWILLALLGAAAVALALAAYPSLSRRGGALERVRLELAGVSVACVLVLLLVLAGVV